MSYEYQDTIVESDEAGYLVNTSEWSEELASVIAAQDGIELSDKHWNVIVFLRTEYFGNKGVLPSPLERAIREAMAIEWQTKMSEKLLRDLFPESPAEQALRIAGLPPVNHTMVNNRSRESLASP